MQCSSCGTLFPSDASTCPNCGAPVAVPQPASAQAAEGMPSSYDEHIAFTDQGTPPPTPPALPPPSPSPEPSPEPSSEPSMQATEAGEPLPASPSVSPPSPPPSRRTPLLILTTTVSILSILVIIVLIFLLLGSRATQTSTNQFATSDPQAIYTQVTNRVPEINDVFSSKTGSSWTPISTGSCVVSGTSLHVTSPQGGDVSCGTTALKESNFACQVEITLTQGDSIGLIFRANQTSRVAYVIELTSQGTYLLGTGQSGTTNFRVLAEGSNSTINAGHGPSNLLTIIALGSMFYLYVNKQFVISTSDGSSSSGLIGIAGAGTITNVAVDATFNHLQLWKL